MTVLGFTPVVVDNNNFGGLVGETEVVTDRSDKDCCDFLPSNYHDVKQILRRERKSYYRFEFEVL